MNIIIPIAGKTLIKNGNEYIPKSLCKIDDFLLFEYPLTSIGIKGNYIFIIRNEDDENYGLSNKILEKYPLSKIFKLTEDTLGALDTLLKIKEFIYNDEEIIITNSDYWIKWDSNKFLSEIKNGIDGILLSFNSTNECHAFLKVNNDNVLSIHEKNVVSNVAAVGFYYWKSGKLFIDCAEDRITNNSNDSHLHYICPVYNQLIENNGKVKHISVDKMYPLGDEKDINEFTKFIKNERY
jgi:NDP-sugar pyrophosphorylase family protein